MHPAARNRTEHKLMGNPDLVAEILRRTEFDSSKSLIQSCTVSKSWLEAGRNIAVTSAFADRNTPTILGFLVEFGIDEDRVVNLLHGSPSQEAVSADALRTSINKDILSLDDIIDSRDGILLTKVPASAAGSPMVYYTSCPFDVERVYTGMAPAVPDIPRDPDQHTINTYGQFAVLPGDGNSGLSFFIKEPSTIFDSNYDGVTFRSTADLYVHVCVLHSEVWVRRVSHPILSPEEAKFHRNPYSVLVGGKLYMMYHLKYIVCLEIGTTDWTEIPLPDDMVWRARAWYDYSVAPNNSGGIVLVNYSRGKIYKWVLRISAGSTQWDLETSVNLVDKFDQWLSPCCWDRVFFCEDIENPADNFYSVQIRKASINGRFVFVTLGFVEGMFEVDMEMECVRKIRCGQSAGSIGFVHALTERWPPKP